MSEEFKCGYCGMKLTSADAFHNLSDCAVRYQDALEAIINGEGDPNNLAIKALKGGEKLPDYNENGTANPKGDAAYWRTRAEAAEKRINELEAALQYAEGHNWMGVDFGVESSWEPDNGDLARKILNLGGEE